MNRKKIDFFNKDKKTNGVRVKDKTDMKKGNHEVKINKSYYGSKSSKLPDKPVKRRGRRSKKILETTNVEPPAESLAESKKNNSAVILRLNIDPSRLKNIPRTNKNDIDESSEGMFKNDIPVDTTCHKCAKNEKKIIALKSKLERYEKKERMDKTNKIYSNKLSFISLEGKKVILKKTNIKCWYDCNSFTNLPCFLPEIYHNNSYYVRGCFCSFNCALAYNLHYIKDSRMDKRKSLVYTLYKEMYGLNSDEVVEIKESPYREVLEDFGGTMSIETFRRNLIISNKEYIVYMPPIKPITISIEERNIQSANDENKKDIILKRSKPLNRKSSVISSLKLNMDAEN